MKYVNNILTLSLEDWKQAGLSIDQYKKSKKRELMKASRSAPGKPAAIHYETIPDRFKEIIIDHFGDPYTYLKEQGFKQHLKTDYVAFEHYSNYQTESGQYLSADIIDQYTMAATWLNLLHDFTKPGNMGFYKSLGCVSKREFYDLFIRHAIGSKVRLPLNYSRLRAKLRQYLPEGSGNPCYDTLISGKLGNSNRTKITGDVADWLIAQYSLPIKMDIEQVWLRYNKIARSRGWQDISDPSSIYKYLMKPSVKRKWYGPRHGMIKHAKEQYRYPLKTVLPTHRDALWYSDGTKLNFYAQNGSKVVASYTVYEVMDAYSEVLLGYHISETEDHQAIYNAFKMAIKNSGHKPYEIRYDNQGGHRKLENQSFLGKLPRVGFATQPYNGKSKTIESMFGRFQKQIMKNFWFFTGQNITAKKIDSRANMEFVLANKKALPTVEEAFEIYAQCRDEWNNGLHHKYNKPRAELYTTSTNPESRPITELDMVELFWIQSAKPITYRNDGLTITYKGDTRYFEVLTAEELPDKAFRKEHIGDKFLVKFDPEDWSHVRLYVEDPSGSIRFVAVAQPRLEVPRAMIDRNPGDGERISKYLEIGKQEMQEMDDEWKDLQDRTGVTEFALIHQQSDINTLGQYDKRVSNSEEDDDLWLEDHFEK